MHFSTENITFQTLFYRKKYFWSTPLQKALLFLVHFFYRKHYFWSNFLQKAVVSEHCSTNRQHYLWSIFLNKITFWACLVLKESMYYFLLHLKLHGQYLLLQTALLYLATARESLWVTIWVTFCCIKHFTSVHFSIEVISVDIL